MYSLDLDLHKTQQSLKNTKMKIKFCDIKANKMYNTVATQIVFQLKLTSRHFNPQGNSFLSKRRIQQIQHLHQGHLPRVTAGGTGGNIDQMLDLTGRSQSVPGILFLLDRDSDRKKLTCTKCFHQNYKI